VTFVSSQIKVFQRFPQVTRAVEDMAKEGLEMAAIEAAAVAQGSASIDLEVEVVPVHGDVSGYSAGIKSRRKSSQTRGGKANATPIAWFFDRGTLGNRTRRLKRPRRESWTSSRGGTPYTAHRGDVAGKGIKPERFFGKARTAGRAKLLERIQRI
jgi:hypothetical protein